MTSRKTLGIPFALAGAIFAFAAPAAAQTSCGVTGQAQAPASVTYDPFSPNALQQISIPLTLTRFANGSAKTQSVSFILVQPPGGPAYQVVYNGTNILYPENATQGRPVQGSQTTGQVYYFFGGAGAPDQSNPLNLTVTVPANTDLSAGEPIRFDILYVCTGIGGLASVDTPARLTSAVRINVNMLSADDGTIPRSALHPIQPVPPIRTGLSRHCSFPGTREPQAHTSAEPAYYDAAHAPVTRTS